MIKQNRVVLFNQISQEVENQLKNYFFSDQDTSNLKWFWSNYMRQRIKWLFIVFVLIIIQGLVYQQFLVLTESGLRVIFTTGTFTELIWVCLAILLIFSVRALTSFVIPTISAKLSTAALYELRRDLASHVLKLPQTYFDTSKSSDLILRLVNQVQELSTFVGQTSVKALRDTATVIIVSSYLIYKNFYLFSIALIVIPIIAFLMISVFRKVRQIQVKTEEAVGKFISNIDEMKMGMRTIKMAGQETTESNRIANSADDIRKNTFRLMRTQALTPPVIDLSSAFVYMLVVGGGGYMALSENFDMDGASIIAFLIGLVIVFDPARNVAQFLTQFHSSLVLLESVHSILNVQTENFTTGEKLVKGNQTVHIKFERVNFNYNSEQETLKNLSLEFLPGTKSAIVGKTGSGKTTILNLIGRLYEIQSGKISFNDKNIVDLSLTSMRDKITIVSQDIVIFDQSLEDNIRYADPYASEERILAAAKNAKIDDLIKERKGRTVGPKGSRLSGGQKQRVALARAFLKPAPILLLDEATSALDALTEASVLEALSELGRDKTTIVVAHKLNSIKDSDIIYVMDKGSLLEAGTHKELIKKNAEYTSLFNAQNLKK